MSAAKKMRFDYPGFSIKAEPRFVAEAVFDASRRHSGGPMPIIATITSTITPPALGEYWHGEGGIYLGAIKSEDGLTYHQIRAVEDLSEGEAWGNTSTELDGCKDKWHGLSNTRAMATAGSKAAKKALALVVDGHQDFYIPAQREAMLQYINAPAASKKEPYWTSTQGSSYYAWYQSFDDGFSGIHLKGLTLRVCAVRRFLAHSPL